MVADVGTVARKYYFVVGSSYQQSLELCNRNRSQSFIGIFAAVKSGWHLESFLLSSAIPQNSSMISACAC